MLTDLDLLNVHQRTFWDAPVTFDEVDLSNVEQAEEERVLAFKKCCFEQRYKLCRLVSSGVHRHCDI